VIESSNNPLIDINFKHSSNNFNYIHLEEIKSEENKLISINKENNSLKILNKVNDSSISEGPNILIFENQKIIENEKDKGILNRITNIPNFPNFSNLVKDVKTKESKEMYKDEETIKIELNNYCNEDHGFNIHNKIDLLKNSNSIEKHFLGKKRYFPNLEGSRSIDNYEHIGKIDEGAYGVVYKAKDIETGDLVAIKKVKLGKEKDGFPITSIREINILMNYQHENIVNIKEVVYGSTSDKIFCVMEFVDFELKSLLCDTFIDKKSNKIIKRIFNLSQIKSLFYQLLKGVNFIHNNWIIHRDLKTSNLLYSKKGILKIADFGLARKYGNPLKLYTPLVVTLWYRAPELLLNCEKYGTAIDIWSCGCILAELFLGEPLFQGQDEIDQLHKIFKLMGTPDEKSWPGWSQFPNAKRINFTQKYYSGENLREKFPKFSFEDDFVLTDKGFDLLKSLLAYDPEQRISVEEAIEHPWFTENPKMASQENMPDFNNIQFREKCRGIKNKLRSLNEEQIKQREKLHNEERYEVKIDEKGDVEINQNLEV